MTFDKQKISQTFYVARFFAILFVVFAHCPFGEGTIFLKIDSLIGTIGVPIFLICSGYFLDYKKDKKTFWKSKFLHIVLPWIILGTTTYFIAKLGSGSSASLSFNGLVKWLLGSGTWLYYIPVLLVCIFLSRLSSNKIYLTTLFIISITSLILTRYSLINLDGLITNYMNPLNFLCFYIFGIFLGKTFKNKEKFIIKPAVFCFVLFLTALLSILYIAFGENISYWGSLFSLPFEFTASLSFILLSFFICKSHILALIGKDSYFIYFIHMVIGIPYATKILFLLNGGETLNITLGLLTPFLALFITFALCMLITLLLEICKLTKFKFLLGISPDEVFIKKAKREKLS